MSEKLSVLMITSEFPTLERPHSVPFITRQVEFLERAGVDVDVFHFKGAKRLSNYIRAWRRLRTHTNGKHYDLVHAQWGQSAALAMPKHLPLVITFRGNDLEGIVGKDGKITLLGRIQRGVSKMMARFADEVIVVSESLGEHLERTDFHVIPSGLDLEMFRPIPSADARLFLGLPPDKNLILFAASTIDNPRKRYWLAREAVDLLSKKMEVELIVANNVPHTSIPYYMNACNALLLTSVHEGSPNVVKEAIACDLPVVSVNVGDVNKRIGGIEGCFVCESATAEALAADLEKVLTRGRRIKGRDIVRDLHEANIASKVIEVYRTALQKNPVKSKMQIETKTEAETIS
ncbi:MAG: glycosyltransferase [Acidobacteriota bacterium]